MFGLHQGFRRTSSSSDDEPANRPPAGRPPLPPVNRVKRALFGPTNPEENLRFVRQELKKHREDASARWNFDFETGNPLSGRLGWEQVNRSSLHPVYNMSRMQYISSHEDAFPSRATPTTTTSSTTGPPTPTTSSTTGPPTPSTTSALEDAQVGSILDLRTPEDRLGGSLTPPPSGGSRSINQSAGSRPINQSTGSRSINQSTGSRLTSVSSRHDSTSSRVSPPPSPRLTASSLSSSSSSSFSPVISRPTALTSVDARLSASRFTRPTTTTTSSGSSVLSDLDVGGARPKTKESKITDSFRSRKATRSKSASKLKRLGNLGASRSPSVKARGAGNRSPPRTRPAQSGASGVDDAVAPPP